MSKQLTRRQFLKNTGYMGAASAVMMSGMAQAVGVNSPFSASNSSDDYKALVCVLLAGGADSFNLLVPTDNSGYSEYANTRADLALSKNEILSLNNASNNGRTLGLHPGMKEMQALYNSGDVAFLANVGTLVKPTTPQQLANNTASLPLGLGSHSDQIDHWQTGLPDVRSGSGWGGRLGDMMQAQNADNSIAMNMTLSGNNLFQAGITSNSHTLTPDGNGAVDLVGTEDGEGLIKEAIDKMYSNNYQNVFRRAYARTFNQSLDVNAKISQAIGASAQFGSQFATDEFSRSLQMTARMISVAKSLGLKRQTFFISYGGWDHHDDMKTSMSRMVPVLSKGLAAFHSALKEIGMENQVTSFTSSDFGRTLTSNGKGSDHGWGGNHMIMGGAVKGGKVYGEYPSLQAGNPLDTGRGVLMPTTATDLYFGELAMWLGVAPNQLGSVLPNIGRFYNTSSSTAPIGFMG